MKSDNSASPILPGISESVIFQRVLYKGCKGNDVQSLQNRLKALGYDVLVTNYFGDKTEDAVIKFQKANELEPSGRVDKQCWDAIFNK